MDLLSYLRVKQDRHEIPPRPCCEKCKRPLSVCYCALIAPFASVPQFVILIHRDEARRGVATGRMAHLCLKNSLFLEGTDFSKHDEVNRLINNPSNHCVVLYPTTQAKDLGEQPLTPKKQLVIFLLDATWAKARKMWRLSQNLHALPTFSLSPTCPSNFRVRKQPKPNCLSTLEAIHLTIELIDPKTARPHDNLLEVFEFMVSTQVAWEEKSGRRTVRGVRAIEQETTQDSMA